MIEFTRGISDFVGAYGWYAKIPKPMRAALLPAVFVWLALAGIVVVFAASLPVIMIAITPFANEWADPWPVIMRVSGGLALLAAVIFVAVKLFASITALVSERSYERIRESVDAATGSLSTREPQGFTRQLVDVGRSIIVGIPLAIVMFALSLIPIVGVAVSLIAGAAVSGRSLGRDIVMCSVEVPADQLTKAQRRRVAGFGIGAQLGMMIPFAGISAMPAAVAGATALAHRINAQALSGR